MTAVTSLASKRDGRKPNREMPRDAHRPTLLTPQVHAEIVRTIALGNYREVAATYAGIGRSTLHGWLQRAREERVDREHAAALGEDVPDQGSAFLRLLEDVEQAEASAITYAVGRFRQLMASEDEAVALRAVTTFLERKDPAGWSRAERHQVAVGGDPDRPVTVVLAADEQAERTAQILAGVLESGVLQLPAGEG